MIKLLVLADDFTGALDTGVQFAKRGAATRVVTDPDYDFMSADAGAQVLVLDAESRHLPPEVAYRRVYKAVNAALASGFTHIYKKTDSALRGNVGAELSAALAAFGAGSLAFVPAFPKMNRVTKKGIHYIDGVPVSESVFGSDPFEPVRLSSVADIIAAQSDVSVAVHGKGERAARASGIHVYDAETDEDLAEIAGSLGGGLKLCAGCAGFAAALADALGMNGAPLPLPPLEPSFFVACGSVNPVTLEQMRVAEEAGFVHFHLTPVQKLDSAWVNSYECRAAIGRWLEGAKSRRCILDVNDRPSSTDTAEYAKANHLSVSDLRESISANLSALMERLLMSGLEATLMCIGGDTLMALMHRMGVPGLTPMGELAPGAVLTQFEYRGKPYRIISKSGGFGEPGLFCELAALIGAV